MAHQVKRTGNIFYRFIKNFDDYDTTYISPNYYNFTAMLQNTSYYQIHRLSASNAEGHSQSLSMKPAPSFKIGPYFGWRWIFLGYTFDVSHPRSLGKSSELSLSLYSSMLGCDFVYVRNTGDYRLRKAKGFEGIDPMSVKDKPFTGMNAKTLSFSGYYVFNHRHFSYPAAYNQSTVQRKSCGSAMLGAGFSKQAIQFDYTKLPPELVGTPEKPNLIDEFKFSSVDYNYYYLSGGYAYNWVFAYNWLLGASVMPSVGIRKAKGDKLQGNEIFLDLKTSVSTAPRVSALYGTTRTGLPEPPGLATFTCIAKAAFGYKLRQLCKHLRRILFQPQKATPQIRRNTPKTAPSNKNLSLMTKYFSPLLVPSSSCGCKPLFEAHARDFTPGETLGDTLYNQTHANLNALKERNSKAAIICPRLPLGLRPS